MRLLTGILLLVTTAPAAGQQSPDPVRVQVDRVFSAYDRSDAPGCALGVYQADRMLYARGYGMANLELGVAITPHTIFDIGSTSKQFTAFAIALLEADGTLELDDPVRKHVPALPAWGDRTTLRHLIHHTSGIRDYLTLMRLAGQRFDDMSTSQEALDLIARQRATNFAPNTDYLYSNSGYFLLAVAVERVAGKSLRAFAAERIFGPLGMVHTHYHDDHTMIVPGRATGYLPGGEGGAGYRIAMSNFEQTGDGAVYTSVEDLLHWDRNFHSPRVGDAALLARQHQVAVLENGRALDYAAGLVIGRHRGLRTVSHGGSWAGYRAELMRFPDQRTSVAVLCNRGDADPTALALSVAEVVLAGAMEPVATPGPAAPGEAALENLPREVLAPRAGIWVSPTTGEMRRIRLSDEGLRLVIGREIPLVPVAINRFRTPAGTLLVFDQGDGGHTMATERDGQAVDRFVRREQADPDQAGLQRYAGRYHSPELDAVHELTVRDGGLVVRIRGREVGEVLPTFTDGFSDGSLHLTFRRDGGRIAGFTLQSGRVRGITFTRVP